MRSTERRQPRLLFVVNTDWFFLSHRLRLAQAAAAAGFDVVVMTPDTGSAAEIRRAGFRHVILPLSRRGTNPLAELRAIWRMVRLYRRIRPDLVHHVTPKPVLYGSIAARLVSGVHVVNAVSGLGYVYSSGHRTAALVRPVVRYLYRWALSYPRSAAIFQNPDDRAHFLDARIVDEDQALLIRGSGVDCSAFQPTPEPEGRPVVMLPSRMLWDKGVAEFVEAARRLRAEPSAPRFVLVGDPDPGNPTSVPEELLRQWVADGVVEWWGHRADMPAALAAANVVVLPSYREGLPKVLLEAAAAGRAIVTSDVPGCREVVREGVNGVLVAKQDPAALAEGIKRLLDAPERRRELAAVGRDIAVSEFAIEIVIERTLGVYRSLLAHEERFSIAGRSTPLVNTGLERT